MIDRGHHLPLKRQAELVSISRSAAYYMAKPVSPHATGLSTLSV